jgi:hypothetical protein
MLKTALNSRNWTRKRNNVERLVKGEAYRPTGYGVNVTLQRNLVRSGFQLTI